MTFVLPYDASKFVKGAPNIGDYVYANDLAISDYLNLFSQTTPGIEGALLVGIASGAYTNFIPTSDTVSGALDGIDAALNTINVGIGRVTDGAALNCPQPIADYYFIGNGTEIVTINPFTYTQGGIAYAIPSQTATFTPTDFADARIDILVIRNGSIAAPLAGTAAPVPVPDFAQVQDGDQILAFVYITSTGGAAPDIFQADIYPVMHFQGELICQSGGRNYVLNSSFELNVDNGPGVDDTFYEWTITTDPGVVGLIKRTTPSLYQTYSASMTLNTIAGPGNKEMRVPLDIFTEKDYTASIFLKNPGCGCNALVFAGVEYTWQGAIYEINILGCETKYGLKDTTGKSESEITATTWERHAGTFKLPAGSTGISGKLYVRGEILPVTLQVLFDAFKVEFGCTASAYNTVVFNKILNYSCSIFSVSRNDSSLPLAAGRFSVPYTVSGATTPTLNLYGDPVTLSSAIYAEITNFKNGDLITQFSSAGGGVTGGLNLIRRTFAGAVTVMASVAPGGSTTVITSPLIDTDSYHYYMYFSSGVGFNTLSSVQINLLRTKDGYVDM